MKRFTKLSLIIVAILLNVYAVAQETPEKKDTIPGIVEKLMSDVDALKKLKISGYLQFQGQWLEKQDESFTVPSAAGGKFESDKHQRFGIRRGRVKFDFAATKTSKAIFTLDYSEKKVAMKEGYIVYSEPFINTAKLTAGVFTRPFGYELQYSSASREVPEYSLSTQSLFPNECDMGVMLTLQAPKKSSLNFLKLDVAAISGNGINTDLDTYLDIVGDLRADKSLLDEKLKIGGGVSYYWGGFRNQTANVYSVATDTLGNAIFELNSDEKNLNKRAIKNLYGVNLQINADMPWGMLSIRGELTAGRQPSTLKSNVYPTSISDKYETTASLNADSVLVYKTSTTKDYFNTYNRRVLAYNIYVTQNILKSRHQLAFRWDVYDPNTEVAGKEIDGKMFTTADMKYSTIGFGYIFKLDSNTKFMLYADFPTNELTSIAPTVKNGVMTDPGYDTDRKDNVLTARIQYKF